MHRVSRLSGECWLYTFVWLNNKDVKEKWRNLNEVFRNGSEKYRNGKETSKYENASKSKRKKTEEKWKIFIYFLKEGNEKQDEIYLLG